MESQYSAAEEAKADALAKRDEWEEKMHSAKSEADAIVQAAASKAQLRGDKILSDAVAFSARSDDMTVALLKIRRTE